jgi:carbon monoxide dehydrogenase subunit G
MLEFENTIRIQRPVGEVFTFLSDFENLPKWNYYVLKVSKRSTGPIGIGTTYHQVRKTDEQDFRILELEQNHGVAIKTLPQSSPALEMRFTLYDEGGATLIRDKWRLDTGQPVLLEKLAAGKIKSAVAENLAKLKQLLEEGRVVLQDGREVHHNKPSLARRVPGR